ncbi:MAG: hypothetical protein ACLQDM_15580 [Bradyrhizobium sp.]
MKTPVALVTVALTAAILLAATFLIATGTRGEGALVPTTSSPATGSAPSAAR